MGQTMGQKMCQTVEPGAVGASSELFWKFFGATAGWNEGTKSQSLGDTAMRPRQHQLEWRL